MKNVFYCAFIICFLMTGRSAFTQTVTRAFNPNIPGAQCPGMGVDYQVSVPSGFEVCQISWSAINGSWTVNPTDQSKVTVTWEDTPGATGTITATFLNCGDANKDNNGKTASLSETILSVKNQSFDAFPNSITLDYCGTNSVSITVPHMYVQGTGGIAQPPLQEVVYSWTLPPGWTTDGSLNTYINGITIRPIGCAVPGTVQVNGVINDRCGAAGPSSPATISLNGPQPFVSIAVPQGYAGVTACNTSPVTLSAILSPSLGCVSSYQWSYPPSWTFVSQSGNTVTLRPFGTPADSGPIKVTVNFSCGTSIVSGAYTPRFIPPTITGPSPICSSGLFSVSNASGLNMLWTSGNNAILKFPNPSAGNASYGGTPGQTTVGVTVSNNYGCSVAASPIYIYAGPPTATTNTLTYVSGRRGTNPISLSPGATYTFQVDQIAGATSYTWALPSGFSFLSPAGHNGQSVYITTATNSGNYNLSCAGTNSCGSSWARNLSISISSGGSGGGGGILSVIAHPNPASKNIIVQLDDSLSLNSGALEGSYKLLLMDHLSRIIYSTESSAKSIEIPLEGIPNGMYYLNVFYNDAVLQKQIAITH